MPDAEGRISEPELIIPTLRHLRGNPDGLKTEKMIELLTTELNPIGEDLTILAGRNDTKFSQKVRNLIAHRNLEGKGLATYDATTGISKITKKGMEHLEDNEAVLDSLEASGFDRTTIRKAIKKNYEDVVLEETISEGLESKAMQKHRKRSQKLRDAKIAQLKRDNNGNIFCVVCGFDFSKTYDGHGRDYIEIHHLKPVHLMERGGTPKQLKEAIDEVVPLCSNCHRMIHRDRSHILTVEELKAIIANATQ